MFRQRYKNNHPDHTSHNIRLGCPLPYKKKNNHLKHPAEKNLVHTGKNAIYDVSLRFKVVKQIEMKYEKAMYRCNDQ